MSKKFELYHHNLEAYESIKEAFDEGQNIASIVQATGTGKSFVALQLALDVYPEKILFVAPTLAIIEHVKQIIKEYELEDKVNIEFTTYQSFVNKNRDEISSIEFNYLIVDEFHHTGAPIWGQRIAELIETHENAYVLGMSAYTIRDKGTHYAMDVAPTSLVEKMVDDSIDENEELPIFANSVVYRYDLADALIDGALKEPKYYFSRIKLRGYLAELEEKVMNSHHTAKEKEEYLTELKAIMANLLKSDDSEQLLREHVKPNAKCIYYVPIGMTDGKRNIENALVELRRIFPDAILYSTTSDDENGPMNRLAFYNDQDLEGNDVSGKLRIMVAINQYNEGVHAKAVDTVIMGRATQSDIVFYEQLGRALSVSNSATPICIDLSGNLDFILDLSEEIGDKIKECYESNGLLARLGGEMPKFSFGINKDEIDLYSRLQAIDDASENWNIRFEQLKLWLSEHNGRYPSTEDINRDVARLANWVDWQRQLYKKGKLSEERLILLNSIGFIWSKKSTWEGMFNEIKKHISEHNGKFPARNDNDEYTNRLANWVMNQRSRYIHGKLSKDKMTLLDSIGLIDSRQESWEEIFVKLKKYQSEHGGDYPKQTDKNEEIKRLGNWAQAQRTAYRKGTLSEEKISLLKSINFVFKPLDEKWNEMFNQLKTYLSTNNGNYPTINNNKDINKLTQWLQKQRILYKNNSLSDERIATLNSIGFVWTPFKNWNDIFEELKIYLSDHNGKYPTENKKDNFTDSLARWLDTQRSTYKKGKLSEERINMLNSIGFDWTPRDSWDEVYEQLKTYLSEHNGQYPNIRDESNESKRLQRWIKNQRLKHNKGLLSDECVKKLNEIHFVWSILTDWDVRLEQVKSYVIKHDGKFPTAFGDAIEEEKQLYYWLSIQKQKYKRGKLTAEQIQKLEDIGFNFNSKYINTDL